MKKIFLLALFVATFAFASQANAYTFQIVNQGTLTASQVSAIEIADTYQIDNQLMSHWSVSYASYVTANPDVSVYFLPQNWINDICGTNNDGCHQPGYIYVSDDQTLYWIQYTVSHESDESETDQNLNTFIGGYLAEADDPVDEWGYPGIGNVAVADFVYPRWFGPHSGPWDEMGMTTNYLTPAAPGGVMPQKRRRKRR